MKITSGSLGIKILFPRMKSKNSLRGNPRQLRVSRSYLLGSRGNLLDAGHGCLLLDDLREFRNLGQNKKAKWRRQMNVCAKEISCPLSFSVLKCKKNPTKNNKKRRWSDDTK